MSMNPLKKIETFGQSIWLDYIKRDLFASGELKKFITEDGLRGMTSNPSIFEKAITESHEYDEAIKRMAAQGKECQQIYEALTIKDVQDAADIFRDLYDKTNGQDGYVSLEVNPHLAHNTAGTLDEARRLWSTLNRPNVLIKVPGTKEGLPVIQQLISEGINVNVTLLFGLKRYHEVAEAYIAGIDARIKKGQSVEKVASVASFFLSRIDVLLDPLFEKQSGDKAELSKKLHGEMAIASAKVAYQIYQDLFNSSSFKALASQGAHTQRLLWASTSTKNPKYKDVKYVEALIGPQTVNTVPPETMDAYRDHGDPKPRLTLDGDKASLCFKEIQTLNNDMEKITQQLEDEGVDKFIKSYDQLIDALGKTMSKK